MVIDMLVGKARLATRRQVITTWWGTGESAERNGRRRIRLLCDAGWLDTGQVLARPLLHLAEPLIVWKPGDQTPMFNQLAWWAQSRWNLPVRRVTVLAAGLHARHTFGGNDRRPLRNVCQFTHDVHVAAVYLRYFVASPDLAAMWRGEDVLFRRGRHRFVPDAVLQDSQGVPIRAIEFGGSYPADRFRHLHNDCAQRAIPYEVW